MSGERKIMFFRNIAKASDSDDRTKISKLKEEFKTADAIVIGAGAGLSTAAGFRNDLNAHFQTSTRHMA